MCKTRKFPLDNNSLVQSLHHSSGSRCYLGLYPFDSECSNNLCQYIIFKIRCLNSCLDSYRHLESVKWGKWNFANVFITAYYGPVPDKRDKICSSTYTFCNAVPLPPLTEFVTGVRPVKLGLSTMILYRDLSTPEVIVKTIMPALIHLLDR